MKQPSLQPEFTSLTERATSAAQPSDQSDLAAMEPRFGHDFSNVPVLAKAEPVSNAELVYEEEPPVVFGQDGNEIAEAPMLPVGTRAQGSETPAPATEQGNATDNTQAEQLQVTASPAASAPGLILIGPRLMWRFNGESPPSYTVSSPVRSNARGGTFNWSVTPHLILSANNIAVPTVTTATPSTALNDAWIRLEHTDAAGTVRRASYRLTVRSPNSLTPTGNTNNAIPRGWQSLIGYSIQDQFGTTLPRNVPINEQWDDKPAIGDFTGTNWPSFPPSTPSGEGSAIVSPAGWSDNMSISDGVPPVRIPTSTAPGTGGPLVMHFRGHWHVGTRTTGLGTNVRNITWRFFQDHGDHL